MIVFHKDRCQGCALCVEICPQKIIVLNHEEINRRGHTPADITEKERCTGCSLCAMMCPDCAIEISDE